jgi:hypothetical protein
VDNGVELTAVLNDLFDQCLGILYQARNMKGSSTLMLDVGNDPAVIPRCAVHHDRGATGCETL